MKKKRLTVDFSKKLYNRLEIIADRTGVGTKSKVIRDALCLYDYVVIRYLQGYKIQTIKEVDNTTRVVDLNLLIPIMEESENGSEYEQDCR